ncbi:hypothetical protein COU53_01170 [Candidatus Pacearchaeota archaeon CG10_big_fil_rev_8_21_14_0_10_30_48]|nr:MAG: hypothetical protein COU53_01170 [Candidatus Pacearchaeota archaeon CG10_big_fil_rev_8_21_14_0_10_30_48]
MKNSTMLFAIAIFVLVVGGFVFVNGKNGVTANVVSNDAQVVQGQMQQVVLSQNGYNYKDATAQAGKPISLSADSSVGGCLRSVSFNIEGKRYSKYLRTSEDTLELPALPKGTYNFACSMGMGYGKLIVQ